MTAAQGRRRPSLVDLVLVDRDVYWRVFSLDYQAEQFEVFHRSRVTRWTHYVGTQVIVAGFLLACAGGAELLFRNGFGPREAFVALVVAATAQNLSHAVEPVPPVLTGRGFEPFGVFWARATTWQRWRVIALNAFYLPLELVSAPRLFPVHVLQVLHRAGWRRAWAENVRARATAILAAT